MEDKKFKRLDIILAEISGESREFSKELILSGLVKVAKKKITKPGFKIDPNSKIEYTLPTNIYVSRGGYKLEKALEIFNINLQDKICLDVGASTGGFTDCMLQKSAKKVFAIDTGKAQLADKLLRDNRVISMEKTNINNTNREFFGNDFDFISVDVSFVSLTKILGKVYSFCNDATKCVFLVKPQFEVGKGNLNKRGIVKDPKAHLNVLKKITDFSILLNFFPTDIIPSPILGSDGNKEFLIFIDCEKKDFDIKSFQKRIDLCL